MNCMITGDVGTYAAEQAIGQRLVDGQRRVHSAVRQRLVGGQRRDHSAVVPRQGFVSNWFNQIQGCICFPLQLSQGGVSSLQHHLAAGKRVYNLYNTEWLQETVSKGLRWTPGGMDRYSKIKEMNLQNCQLPLGS